MSRKLVQRNFRYVNNQIAKFEDVSVVVRDSNSLVALFAAPSGLSTRPNPITTDSYGNLSFYVESGFYDFLAMGARIPFDVEAASGGGGDDAVIYYVNTPVATWTVPNPFGRAPIAAFFVGGQIQEIGYDYTETQVTAIWPVPLAGLVVLR